MTVKSSKVVTALNLKTNLVKSVSDALQLQYSNFDLKKENVENSINELTDYIYKAHKNQLDQRSQCSYSGSVLVFASLEEMGKKYSSDVDAVNAVYLSGSKMANALWAHLDSLQKSETNLEQKDFEEMVQNIVDDIWTELNKKEVV